MIKATKRDNEDKYDLRSRSYHVGIVYYDGEDWVFDLNPDLIFRAKDIKKLNKIRKYICQ